MPRNCPKRPSDSHEPSKISSTLTSRSSRKSTGRRSRIPSLDLQSNSNETIFYLVLIASRTYRCAALMSRQSTRLRTLQIHTKKKMTRLFCRTLPQTRTTHLQKPSQSRRDFQLAIKLKMKAASRAWIRFTRSACRCIRRWFLSTCLARPRMNPLQKRSKRRRLLQSWMTSSVCRVRQRNLLPTIEGTTQLRFQYRKVQRWKSSKTTKREWRFCGCERKSRHAQAQPKFYLSFFWIVTLPFEMEVLFE